MLSTLGAAFGSIRAHLSPRSGALLLALLNGCFMQSAALADEKTISIPLNISYQPAAASPKSSSASSSASSQAPQVSISKDGVKTIQLNIPLNTTTAASSSPSRTTARSLPPPTNSNSFRLGRLPFIESELAASASSMAASRSAASSSLPAVTAQETIAAPKAVANSPAKQAVASKAARPKKIIPELNTPEIRAPRYPLGNPEAFVTQFEDYVATQIAPYVPGVAVVIVSNGEVKSLRSFGVRKRNTREKVTPDTVFRLASVSKTIAATSAALMVNEGLLTWDTGVVSTLPDVKFKTPKYGDKITLRHILSQSSGLPTHTYTPYIENNMAYEEAVRRLRYVSFVCPPGKCYAYQNVVYSLAGDMISKKAGQPFENYVEEKLFAPLGMRTASFGLDGYRASKNRATPHIAMGKRWAPTNVTENYYHVAPAAGVNASIADMSHFLLAQLGKYPRVLPIARLDELQGRTTKNSPAQNHYGARKGISNTAYGLGWRVFDYGRNKNFVHHGGWVKGFRSEMIYNRKLGIGMVILTNSETRRARNIIFKFMDYFEMSQQAALKAAKKKG